MSVRAPLREAADSLAKASTPQPFSTSKTSNWVARVGGLPDYIQHVAHGILRSDPAGGESGAIRKAIGVVKNWASGQGKVDATTRAAAAKAVAEWEAKKGANKAKGAVREADRYRATPADGRLAVDAALLELAAFEAVMGVDGMVALLGEGMLAEAASWSPTMKRTACAPNEKERHEVYDGGQHVGTIMRRASFSPKEPDRFSAKAVNGTEVGGYGMRSRQDAIGALQQHLESAPARVIAMPTLGKYLVAAPSSYGDTRYTSFPNEIAARHAAGLPASPTEPERNSKVQAVAEALRFDLITVAGVDIPPLRRVQEARRRDPFELVAEAFDPGEARDFRGRWRGGAGRLERSARNAMGVGHAAGAPSSRAARVVPRSVTRPRRSRQLPAQARYEGGVTRESARLRAAHARKPQIALKELPASIGRGAWSSSAERVTKRLAGQRVMDTSELERQVKAGRAVDTEHAHRKVNADGSLGPYSVERQALHEEIISKLLQGKGVHEGRAQAIFTAGGPASGKSGLLNTGTAKFEQRIGKGSPVSVPGDVVHANPDIVREMLPEYKALTAAGREDAATLTHEEASYLAKRVTKLALSRQHHVLVDTVGDSGKGKFAGKIRDALKAGHEVHVHYATIDVPTAIKRAKDRGDETGRYVDEGYLRRAHKSVSLRFGEVAKIPGIHLSVHATPGTRQKPQPLQLLAEKGPRDDKLSIRNRAGFERFLRKGEVSDG